MDLLKASTPGYSAYAGIGSRKTPKTILTMMTQLGKAMAELGWTLRTGNCTGADQAFQKGANFVDAKFVELYLPWPEYEAKAIQAGNWLYTPNSQAYGKAAEYHPAWKKCSEGARAMHARNTQIILGPGLVEPVGLVFCWTPGGQAIGGTAQGMRIAWDCGIAVHNLALPEGMEFAEDVLARAGLAGLESGMLGGQALFDF